MVVFSSHSLWAAVVNLFHAYEHGFCWHFWNWTFWYWSHQQL